MPRGYPTEKAIEDQVIALGETSMTQQEIAEMVGISRRQVGRIWHRVGVRQKGARSPFAVPQAVLKQVRGDVAGHGAQLLSVLQNLEDVDIFHPATEVTMYQLLSQEHGSWSMDTGQLRKASEWNLSVELWVKNQVGWLYLQQHLDGHPVWELMESWRVAVTRDVQARLDRSVYEHSMEKVGANPQQTWMVGDNLYFDVGGAQKLGIWGIWVDWRRSGVSDDSMVKPDRIVHLISELIDST